MKPIVLFFLLLAGTGHLAAQNTIGIPHIVNYNKQVYGAGSQNWNITQDEAGILYFANNDGLLSFDGTYWRVYPLPNKTIVRSVLAVKDRIYVGGQGETGYFAPDANGDLSYTSLNKFIAAGDNDFADVWNIVSYDNRVFFRTNYKLLEWDGKGVTVHRSANWGYLGLANGLLLARENDKGLVYYDKGQWLPKIKTGSLPGGNLMLRSVVPMNRDSILLVTLFHGLYVLKNDTLTALSTPAARQLASRSISSACKLPDNRIALATNLGGVTIMDSRGNFVQSFTRSEGIQNNNVLSVMSDRDGNIWLGLDNGIDLVAGSNSIRNIFPDADDRHAGYTSVIYKNRLYLGVATGVYSVALDNNRQDISYTLGSFDFIRNTEGQVWSLSVVNDVLMMGHNKGAYRLNGNVATAIDSRMGYWGFQPLVPGNPTSMVVAGTYNGISFASYLPGREPDTIIANTKVESARFVAIGKDVIWIAHPYKGLYKILFDEKGIGEASRYDDRQKLLSGNHNKVFKLRERIILSTDKGIYEYDEQLRDFKPASWLRQLIGEAPVSYIKEDQYGNIWFSRQRQMAVLDRSFAEPRIIAFPEIDNRIMAAGFENVLVVDSNNVLIAAEKGFFHINYSAYRNKRQPLEALIRRVQSTNDSLRLVFGGYGETGQAPALRYTQNALRFEFSSTLYGQSSNTQYSFLLEGFDQDWSEWSGRTEKDYTNLPAGNYVFKLKCRNNLYNESPVVTYAFTVYPPWYQTWWAYTLMALLFFALLYLFYKRQQRKYKRQQQARLAEQQRKYDEEQKQLQLQHQLEIQEQEKEIIELRNQNLQSQVEHKNSELASATMNLVQKKEMLSKIKNDLVQFRGIPDADKAQKEFQKIVRLIDKELDHNEEWEQFAVHFDSVHANYLKKLKERYPVLSTADLKLAAYLRLNLSSKEIAQLLNISIRGVETSRYRLRKKLDMPVEANLFDYLIQVTA